MNPTLAPLHCSWRDALVSGVPRYLQVTAEERISIWSLMLDQAGKKDTKGVFVPAEGSADMARIHVLTPRGLIALRCALQVAFHAVRPEGHTAANCN